MGLATPRFDVVSDIRRRVAQQGDHFPTAGGRSVDVVGWNFDDDFTEIRSVVENATIEAVLFSEQSHPQD